MGEFNSYSKARRILNILLEKLPAGFSIESLNVDVFDEKFDFFICFPASAAKDLFFTPEDEDLVCLKVLGRINIDWEETYSFLHFEPKGGGFSVGVEYDKMFFIDEDGNDVEIRPGDEKAIKEFIKKYFEKELIKDIEEIVEEEYKSKFSPDPYE